MSWKAKVHNPVTAGLLWRWRAAAYTSRRVLVQSSCSPYHPCRIYRVRPRAVTHLLNERLRNRTLGVVLPGDWDLEATPIEVTRVWRGLRQRYLEGRPWRATELNPDAGAVDIPRGRYSGHVGDFDAHAAHLDELWQRLQAHGYLGHRELGDPLESVMTVCVGRDGRLVRNKGGLHRLVMADLLGVERVPARIVAVHPELADDGAVDAMPDR